MPKVIALLPIKERSSRVPGKNFRLLEGWPLFHWILRTLVGMAEIDCVIINTDAAGLVKSGLVKSAGEESQLLSKVDWSKVVVRDRKPELRGDHVSMNLVLADEIAAFEQNHNEGGEEIVFLMTHATNPFLSAASIRSALRLFAEKQKSGQCDSLFSVNKFQTRFYMEDATPINHDPNNLIPTQDLEPWYEENSCLYLFTLASFRQSNARIGQKPFLFPISKLESTDIDTPDDWQLAELIAFSLKSDKKSNCGEGSS